MVGTLEGISSITCYMAGLAAVFVGLGLAFQRLFQFRLADLDQLLKAFWVGFAAVICFLQVWHLLFAITWPTLAIVALGGVAGLLWNAVAIFNFFRTLTRHAIAVGILSCVLVAIWVADHAAGPATEWDSAMYHIQAVRWYTRYPVVLGLGNLHDRLVFNSSSLLYDAMLESLPGWLGKASHVANGLLVLMLLFQIVLAAARVLGSTRDDALISVFDLVLLTPVVAVAVSEDISSFTTDVPVAIVLFVTCSTLYRLVATRRLESSLVIYNAVAIVMLSILAVCLKASAIVVAPVLLIFTFIFLFFELPRSMVLYVLKWCTAIALLLGVPWIVHGVFLSGYPFYPSIFGGLSVDWKIPLALAKAERSWVIVLARQSTADSFLWVRAWVSHYMLHWNYFRRTLQLASGIFGVFLPCSIAMASAFFAIVANRKAVLYSNSWRMFTACAIAAMFWFCTAPAPRFGFSILWSLAAAGAAALAAQYPPQARYLALPLALVLAFAPILFPLPPRNPLRTLLNRALVLPTGPDHGVYPNPHAELRRFTTRSGLMVYVPVHDNRCFDAPLPCTPHPAPNLVLMEARDGRPKFVTNGSWQQINWPNPTADPLTQDFLQQLRCQFPKGEVRGHR